MAPIALYPSANVNTLSALNSSKDLEKVIARIALRVMAGYFCFAAGSNILCDKTISLQASMRLMWAICLIKMSRSVYLLTQDEIFERVSKLSAQLNLPNQRLSVFLELKELLSSTSLSSSDKLSLLSRLIAADNLNGFQYVLTILRCSDEELTILFQAAPFQFAKEALKMFIVTKQNDYALKCHDVLLSKPSYYTTFDAGIPLINRYLRSFIKDKQLDFVEQYLQAQAPVGVSNELNDYVAVVATEDLAFSGQISLLQRVLQLKSPSNVANAACGAAMKGQLECFRIVLNYQPAVSENVILSLGFVLDHDIITILLQNCDLQLRPDRLHLARNRFTQNLLFSHQDTPLLQIFINDVMSGLDHQQLIKKNVRYFKYFTSDSQEKFSDGLKLRSSLRILEQKIVTHLENAGNDGKEMEISRLVVNLLTKTLF